MLNRKSHELHENNISISHDTLPRDNIGIIEVREAEIKQLYPEGTRLGAAEKVHWGYTIIGSSNCGDVLCKVIGWKFSTATPTIVLCQAAQDRLNPNANLDHGWPDQFSVQVLETSTDFVMIRVRRIDLNGSNWGQNLRIDMLVIE
jgi:hypothetical protein